MGNKLYFVNLGFYCSPNSGITLYWHTLQKCASRWSCP